MAQIVRDQSGNTGLSHPLGVWVFLFLAGTLSSTSQLKFASVQYLEFIYFFQILLLLCYFVKQGFKARLYRPSFVLGRFYLIFLAIALILVLVSLRFDFYVPRNTGLLFGPVFVSVSRAVEFAIDVGAMLYLIEVFRQDRATIIFTMRLYFWTGVSSAVYSILRDPVNLLNIFNLRSYDTLSRMTGYGNEGGPYGTYLVSVVLVGAVLYRMRWNKQSHLFVAYFLIAIAFLGSRSKASVLALAMTVLLNAVLAQGIRKRLVILAVCGVAVLTLASFMDLNQVLVDYQRTSQRYEYLSHYHYKDENFVTGRVAGGFIVPRMIAAHPLLGIGWGNYALVRNSPQYRGAAAWSNDIDAPGLGLLGPVAELGVPLSLYLFFIFLCPYFYMRRIGAPLYLKNLALVQPIAHLFGAQFNLTYPWIVTAFALGLGYFHVHSASQVNTFDELSPTTQPLSASL